MEGGGATELNWLSMEQGASTPHSDLGYTLSVTVMVTIMYIRIPLGRQQVWVARILRDCLAGPVYKVRSRMGIIYTKKKYMKVLKVYRKVMTKSKNIKMK
jgi:hypothetical protein